MMTDNRVSFTNVKAETAVAFNGNCFGCQQTKTDVMVSFGNLIPYGGDNRPSGTIDPLRFLDVFLSKTAAENLYKDLGEALGHCQPPRSTRYVVYCTGGCEIYGSESRDEAVQFIRSGGFTACSRCENDASVGSVSSDLTTIAPDGSRTYEFIGHLGCECCKQPVEVSKWCDTEKADAQLVESLKRLPRAPQRLIAVAARPAQSVAGLDALVQRWRKEAARIERDAAAGFPKRVNWLRKVADEVESLLGDSHSLTCEGCGYTPCTGKGRPSGCPGKMHAALPKRELSEAEIDCGDCPHGALQHDEKGCNFHCRCEVSRASIVAAAISKSKSDS